LLGTLAGSRQSWASTQTVFQWKPGHIEQWEISLNPTPIKATILPVEPLRLALAQGRPKLILDGMSQFEVTIQPGPQVDLTFELTKGTQNLRVERTVYLVNSTQ
jgi:hypothetical protein